MLKKIGLATLAAMLSAGSAQAGLVTLDVDGTTADPNNATFTYYGAAPVTGTVCAQCIAEVKITLVDSTHVQFDVKNTSTDGTTPAKVNILTAFGFNFTPAINLTGATAVFTGLDWSFGVGGGGLGMEFVANGTGIGKGLDAGQTGKIVVTLAVALPKVTVDETLVHFQSVNQEEGPSSKPGGCIGCPPPDLSTPDGGMTLSLLGLALAGVGVMRRRLQ